METMYGPHASPLVPTQPNIEVEAWVRRLQKSKRTLFNPGKTKVRIETVVRCENESPRPVVTDVVLDDSQLEAALKVSWQVLLVIR